MQKFKSVEQLVNQLKPDKPVYCIRKKSILSASHFFQKKFTGKILYAVKTNPHSEVIKTLIESGINQFDVASIEEIKAVRKFLYQPPTYNGTSVKVNNVQIDLTFRLAN